MWPMDNQWINNYKRHIHTRFKTQSMLLCRSKLYYNCSIPSCDYLCLFSMMEITLLSSRPYNTVSDTICQAALHELPKSVLLRCFQKPFRFKGIFPRKKKERNLRQSTAHTILLCLRIGASIQNTHVSQTNLVHCNYVFVKKNILLKSNIK